MKTTPKASTSRICKVCGTSFSVFPYRALTVKACSKVCAGDLRRTRVKRICQTCGNNFMVARGQFKAYKGAGKYCSRQCSYQGIIATARIRPIKDKYQRSRRVDDRKWQLAVRVKDEYTCQRCGKFDQYIHAHHVAPRSRRPDLKHEISNGKCLCNSCHTWVHNHPREATEAGLLSVETYEVARVTGRRSDNLMLTYRGKTHFIAEWARRLGVRPTTLQRRWHSGWSHERIIETPVRVSSASSVLRIARRKEDEANCDAGYQGAWAEI